MPDLQRYSDKELEELTLSEVGERKKAAAAEILRRRQQEKWSKRTRSSLLGEFLTAASLAVISLKRWFRRKALGPP
jgi:hypothetical protein